MISRIHPIAGVVGFLTILTFWSATALSDLSGSVRAIISVKESIPWGFLALVPALAVTGATGLRIAGASTNPRVARKKRRMLFIACNGLLVLMPAALYLATLASRGEFGITFYVIQVVELAAGAVNLILMALNIRDGLHLAGRLPWRSKSGSSACPPSA